MSARSKALTGVALAALATASGCADPNYRNHFDTVSIGAGNAPAANLAIHTVNAFPPRAHDTDINVAGVKSGQAYQRYVEPGDPDVVTGGQEESIVSVTTGG